MTATDGSWAAIVLAHGDPVHFGRLVAALPGVPIVLHCDAKTPEPVYRRLVSVLPSDGIVIDRVDTRLASWSLVAAELGALRRALTDTDAAHLAVLSGADFPLAAPSEIAQRLAGLGERSWIGNRPLPFAGWNAPGFADGGLWRLRHYFPTRNDQILRVAGQPVFLPVRRSLPDELVPTMSAHWKIYSRRDATRLLEVLDARPHLVRFGRHTFTPEESFVASVLASERLFGADALKPCFANPWYVNWPDAKVTHPATFVPADLDRLAAARRGELAPPGSGGAAGSEPGPPLFARKFDADSAVLVERISQLWSAPGT